MHVCVILIFPIAILCKSSTAIVLNMFVEKVEHQNKMSSTIPIAEFGSLSPIHCAAMCSSDCGCTCFGYNSNTKTCHALKSCEISAMTVTEAPWRYYILKPHDQPNDCKELYDRGQRTSGVYTVYPWETHNPVCRAVKVFCDMETNAGGWTAIQLRKTGSVNFTRNWHDYKVGFGIPQMDYWIGNDAIHQLTKDRPSLYILLTNYGVTKYAVYNEFSVSDENDNYRLFIAGPVTGTLGDKMINTDRSHNGMPFSTPDLDKDTSGSRRCADIMAGGWWFSSCHRAFLNGPWASVNWREPWSPDLMDGLGITETRMMIRPR